MAGTSLNNKSIVASAVYGGRVQTVWQLAPSLRFSAYSGFYNYHNADAIAFALAKANLRNPQTPLAGTLPLGGNTVQNSTFTTTQNGIVTIPGTPATVVSTGVSTITNAQFASKFGLFDSLARFDITTPLRRWPIAFIGDYVQNTRACDNLTNILSQPAPTATKTSTFSQKFNVPCVSRERRGYWAEGRFGRLQQKGDLQFAYTRLIIEREAVMGAFNFSDIRQPSNVTQHRAEVLYQAYDNVQLGFTGFIGRPLNWDNAKPKPPEDFLHSGISSTLFTNSEAHQLTSTRAGITYDVWCPFPFWVEEEAWPFWSRGDLDTSGVMRRVFSSAKDTTSSFTTIFRLATGSWPKASN